MISPFVSKICQEHMGVFVKIDKAFHLGQWGDKPKLLKISVASEQEKKAVLQNCTKLHTASNPDVKKVPDLTPVEQADT